jgi:hypothetical protein
MPLVELIPLVAVLHPGEERRLVHSQVRLDIHGCLIAGILAHVPAKWIPVRGQEYAPMDESGARGPSFETLVVAARRQAPQDEVVLLRRQPLQIALIRPTLSPNRNRGPSPC